MSFKRHNTKGNSRHIIIKIIILTFSPTSAAKYSSSKHYATVALCGKNMKISNVIKSKEVR